MIVLLAWNRFCPSQSSTLASNLGLLASRLHQPLARQVNWNHHQTCFAMSSRSSVATNPALFLLSYLPCSGGWWKDCCDLTQHRKETSNDMLSESIGNVVVLLARKQAQFPQSLHLIANTLVAHDAGSRQACCTASSKLVEEAEEAARTKMRSRKHVQHQKKLDPLLPLPSWLIGGDDSFWPTTLSREQTTACACCSCCFAPCACPQQWWPSWKWDAFSNRKS